MLTLLEKLAKWLFFASLIGLALAWWNRDNYPAPEFYSDAIVDPPRQSKTEAQEFTARAGDQRYLIKPLYDYELDGMVVSMNHAGSWIDIYHDEWGDHLNLKDICVIWGDNVDTEIYREMDFKNTAWTCWASWPDRGLGQVFQQDQLSNNHLLADDPAVQHAILAARPGDQVHFKGYLAEYRNPANGFRRGTSTRRDDRGNGACETVYVERFDVVREANAGWRRLFNVSQWFAPLSLLAWIGLLTVTPVRHR
jgi:hypothetical protein